MRRATMICLTLSLTGSLYAGTLLWAGNTSSSAGGLTWNRPTVDDDPPTYLALVGGGQGYLAAELAVGVSGTYFFSVVENGPGTGQWDGVSGNILGFLYQSSFDPNQPLTNVIENGGAPATSSWSHSFTAGTDYWIVITGYCGTGTGPGSGAVAGCTGPRTLEEGPFAATLTGPGVVNLIGETGDGVPEPSTFAMLLGSLPVLAGLRRALSSRPQPLKSA